MNWWGGGEAESRCWLIPKSKLLVLPSAFHAVGKLFEETPMELEMIKM
jgi:hypothetical protein